MKKLTISTLNIYGMSLNIPDLLNRYQAIAEILDNSKIDIINFQEVFSHLHLKILCKRLDNYPFCIYKKSFLGPKGGLVIFSKLPLTNIGFTRFPSDGLPVLSAPELMLQKGILSAELKEMNITLINTHFTAVIDNNYSCQGKYFKYKTSEIQTFKDFVDKNNHNKNVIACGDFNIKKGSDLYLDLLKMKKTYNPFAVNKEGTRHREFVSGNRKPSCLDYILIIGNKIYKVTNKQLLFSHKIKLVNQRVGYVSDHIGLQITYQAV